MQRSAESSDGGCFLREGNLQFTYCAVGILVKNEVAIEGIPPKLLCIGCTYKEQKTETCDGG